MSSLALSPYKGAPILTWTSPLCLLNRLFFQYKPELWHIGIIGTVFLTERSPQLFEKVLRPLWGRARVPSGKIIKEIPFLSFSDPSLTTFFKLIIFLDLVRWMGLRHAKAHPKKGINNNSLFTILEDGKYSVCIKKDSHAPWWFETKIHGSFGIFSIPWIDQETPQICFNEKSIKYTHLEAIFCKVTVFKKGKRTIINIEIGISVEYKTTLKIKLLSVCNFMIWIYLLQS